MLYNGWSLFLCALDSDLMLFAYVGKPVDLTVTAEEVAGFYAALIETDHAKDETFNGNFFEDFRAILKENPPVSNVPIIQRLRANVSNYRRDVARRLPSSNCAILGQCLSTLRLRRPRRRR